MDPYGDDVARLAQFPVETALPLLMGAVERLQEASVAKLTHPAHRRKIARDEQTVYHFVVAAAQAHRRDARQPLALHAALTQLQRQQIWVALASVDALRERVIPPSIFASRILGPAGRDDEEAFGFFRRQLDRTLVVFTELGETPLFITNPWERVRDLVTGNNSAEAKEVIARSLFETGHVLSLQMAEQLVRYAIDQLEDVQHVESMGLVPEWDPEILQDVLDVLQRIRQELEGEEGSGSTVLA